MPDAIEKTIELKSPPARVWAAISNSEEFGAWFRVKLDGPFVVGELSSGWITYPGYEHLKWEARVVAIEPETRFALEWCPYGGDAEVDYSNDPHTLVEFTLEPAGSGTRLTIRESGFDRIPDDKRQESFVRNEEGWTIQSKNIADHVDT